MKFEISKGTWLTAGGYVVELAEDRYATQETSPGTYKKRGCIEWNHINKHGWFYDKSGFVDGLDDDWSEKLRLVEKLSFSLPELPSGYQWAGGYPQFRTPQIGEEFLGMRGDSSFDSKIYSTGTAAKVLNGRRLIVEKITKPIPFVGPGQYELMNGQIVNLNLTRHCLRSDKIYSKNSLVFDWRWELNGTIKGLSFDDHSHLYLRKVLKLETSVPISLPAIETTKSSLLSRTTKYFIVEPAKSIYRVAKETAGHFVFLTAITAGGYACYNPSGVAAFIKSCIPHVSISVEKPEVLK
jgi:hypothetical protein